MTAVASVDDQLTWEDEQRRPAAAAAIGGGLLSFAGFLVTILGLAGVDPRSFVESVSRFEDGRPIGGQPSLRLVPYEFFADHTATIIIGGVLVGLGAVGMGLALTYLSHVTKARHERYPRLALRGPLVGGVLLGVGSVLSSIARVAYYNAIVDSSGTVDAVRGVDPSAVYYAGGFIQLIGGLALALGFVMVALNAMRVGLLTRFMGIVGILAGALTILPLPAVPVLQAFWMVALGALFLQVWPGGNIPPAWRTGKAEPWPSAAAQRAARNDPEPSAPRGSSRTRPPAPEAVEAAAGVKPHPSSKKKRKRRS